MKTQLLRLTSFARALLLLAALLLALPGLRAASANPPDRISYQGYLVDADGFPLGSNAPVNHTLEFRIYNVSSGGSALWGESQIVTIDKGYFSVLLGDGTPFAGTTLSALFQGADASDRYVSVKDLSLAGSTEMLPRLRLVTSPYAYMATTLPPGAITNGLFAAASITGDKLATNTLTAANFSTNVGLWTASGTNIFRTNGFVGIGTSTPAQALDVNGNVRFRGPVAYLGSNSAPTLVLDDIPGAKWQLTTTGYLLQFANDNGGSYNPKVVFAASGNVGIGTATPLAALSVGAGSIADPFVPIQTSSSGSGSARYIGVNKNGAYGLLMGVSETVGDTHVAIRNVTTDPLHIMVANTTKAVTVLNNGFVGIGTATPSAALDVVGGSTGFNLNNASYYSQGGFGHGYTLGGNIFQAAIKASWHIYSAGGFYCGSDARIKSVQGLSDSAEDLRKLTQIEITDYLYKDQVAQKSGLQKKVIAQQVEKVFPQAVSKSTDVVPDIFQKAIFTNGWVELATDLKVGERVKLMGENNGGIHEVLEVREGAFRTAFKPTNEKVFVFGREVKDFRTVDYDALSMLNISATQELARKVKAQETELTELRAELAKLRTEKKSLAATVTELKERDDARESRLARLEQALAKDAKLIQAKANGRDVIGASK